MLFLCMMGVITQNRDLNPKIKERHMKIQRKKGTPNPSMIPPDPKVKKGRNGTNAHTVRKDSIQNPHA